MNQDGPSLRPEKHGSGDDGAWLETYADTITLLMAFFVMMFSMSTLDAGKFTILKEAGRFLHRSSLRRFESAHHLFSMGY